MIPVSPDPSPTNTALLIVNWDAANGDPLYRGDATLTYLRTRGRVPISRFLNRGGVLLIESQTAQSRPVQESYDAIFATREVEVGSFVPKDEWAAGSEAYILKRARGHPLLEIFNEEHVRFESTVSEKVDIFEGVPHEIRPQSNPGLRGSDGNVSRKLWFGWFTDWTVDWMPLLYVRVGKNERYPVLLAKTAGTGMVLLSTMWLSVAQHRLSCRIAEVARAPELLARATAVHRRARLRRRVMDVGVGMLTLGAVTATGAGAVALARSTHYSWILAALGIGTIGFATAAWRAFVHVWSRPLGVSVLKTYGFGKRRIGKRR